jgi:hypothetical protein
MPAATEQYVNLSRYDFLVIFIGILIGLSVCKLVAFCGQLVSTRRILRLPFLHANYLLLAFLLQVHYWWTLWNAKALATGTFLTFLQLLLLPLFMYFATAILCPEPLPEEPGLLESYFAGRAKVFYWVVLAILVIGGGQGVLLWHQPIAASLIRGLAALLLLPALFTSSKRLHLGSALALLVLFVVYVCGSGRLSHLEVP